jgi:hypothetical protein
MKLLLFSINANFPGAKATKRFFEKFKNIFRALAADKGRKKRIIDGVRTFLS